MKIFNTGMLFGLTVLFMLPVDSFACNKWLHLGTNKVGECEGHIMKHAIKKKEVYVAELDSESFVKIVKHEGKDVTVRMGLYFNRCGGNTKVYIDDALIDQPFPKNYKTFYSKTKGMGQAVKVKWQTCDEKQPDGSTRTRFALQEIRVNSKEVRAVKFRK